MSERWDWTIERALPSRRNAHLPLMDEILAKLKAAGWEGRDYFGVQMALEESLANAIRHGNGFDESKKVQVACKLSAERFWLRVEDEGKGFNPEQVADCTTDKGIETPGGRGMLLINAYMTSIEHNDRGNCVTMEKVRSGGDTEK